MPKEIHLPAYTPPIEPDPPKKEPKISWYIKLLSELAGAILMLLIIVAAAKGIVWLLTL